MSSCAKARASRSSKEARSGREGRRHVRLLFSARPAEWTEAEGERLKLTLPLLLSRRCLDVVKPKYNNTWVHTRCTQVLSGLGQLQGIYSNTGRGVSRYCDTSITHATHWYRRLHVSLMFRFNECPINRRPPFGTIWSHDRLCRASWNKEFSRLAPRSLPPPNFCDNPQASAS